MSQESTKEPAFEPGPGWILCRGSFMKKTENLRDSSKLDPMIFSVFFSLLRKPAGRCPADCRFGTECVSSAILLRQNERGRVRRCGGAKRLPLEGKLSPERRLMRCSTPQSALPSSHLRRGAPPARFVAAKRRSPEGGITQQCGRPITQRVIVPVKRARKKAEVRGANLFAHSNLLPFFDTPAAAFTATQRLVFGWVLGRGFCPQKPPP